MQLHQKFGCMTRLKCKREGLTNLPSLMQNSSIALILLLCLRLCIKVKAIVLIGMNSSDIKEGVSFCIFGGSICCLQQS